MSTIPASSTTSTCRPICADGYGENVYCIQFDRTEAAIAMKTARKLELAEARHMIEAAKRKAVEIGVAQTICIVDDGGYPLALERMDGARVTGPQIAWNKAFTAAGHRRSTHLFNVAPNGPALPGNEAFGIQWSFEGKFAVFVGGYPIVVDDERSEERRVGKEGRSGWG